MSAAMSSQLQVACACTDVSHIPLHPNAQSAATHQSFALDPLGFFLCARVRAHGVVMDRVETFVCVVTGGKTLSALRCTFGGSSASCVSEVFADMSDSDIQGL